MINLKRKWRRKREGDNEDDELSLPTRGDDSRPTDTQEQEELIRSFEQKHRQQSILWRGLFAGLLLCYVVFLLYSIFHQTSSPWELRYHAYFMEDIDSWMVILADWVAVSACLLSIMGLLQTSKSHRQWIFYSCGVGLTVAVFWLYHMLRLPKFRWDILWLPFAPLSSAGICLYVDHLLAESSVELQTLRAYMYEYKAK